MSEAYRQPFKPGYVACTPFKHEYLRRQVLKWEVSKFVAFQTRVRPEGVYCAQCKTELASKNEILGINEDYSG